jgi:hypothetical protein
LHSLCFQPKRNGGVVTGWSRNKVELA